MKNLIFIISLLACTGLRAQTPAELRAALPAVAGWSIAPEEEVYNSENLFDRINGSVPLYLENNFRELTVLEYTRGTDYITIEAYRHATPEDAFGMFASERSPELAYYDIGAAAQADESNLFFFAGPMYVKMWSNSKSEMGETLKLVAAGFADKIAPGAGYPPVVGSFPQMNKLPHSETYITSNYIGHQFLQSVYTASYRDSDLEFDAFVIDGKTPEGAQAVLERYFVFTKQTETPAQGHLVIKDRYNGDIPVVWKGRYIAGIFSDSGAAVPYAADFLDQLAGSLP